MYRYILDGGVAMRREKTEKGEPMSNIKTIYVCENCGLPVQGVYIKRYYPEIEERVFPIQCKKCGAFFDGIIIQTPKIIEVRRERRAE